MKIYELFYIWNDIDGYDLTETKVLTDYAEVEKEIEDFCIRNQRLEGSLYMKERNYIKYEFFEGYSALFIVEHELNEN